MLQLCLFEPKSTWTAPDTFPNMVEHRVALDLECKDPNLTTKGPGFHRKDGYPVGISIASDTRKWYLPFDHFAPGNLDKGRVLSWLRDLFDHPREWVFANASYDLGWLRFLGLKPKGTFRCIQITEALLDEERENGYSLNSLCKSYLGKPKTEALLKEAARAYGIHEKADMWKLPPKFVGEYAEDDAADTLAIFNKQIEEIKRQNLEQVFEIESGLIEVLHEANFRGLRIDTPRAEKINAQWKKDIEKMSNEFKNEGIDIWAPRSLGEYCDRNGIEYPRTKKTNDPSFTKEFLEQSNNPFLQKVRTLRQLDRIRSVYLEQNMLTDAIDERIHPEFIQLHGDDGGTRSGRLACRNPNAQQIPKRSSIKCDSETFSLIDIQKPIGIGKVVRGCLIPEEGRHWTKLDYDSQEPRLQVHYALALGLPGAKEALNAFNRGEKLYHMIEKNSSLSYAQSKDTWLGRSYGMGVETFIHGKDYTEEEGKALLAQLDEACPFIKLLQDRLTAKLERDGEIRNILGGKQRFPFWEPVLPWEVRKKLKKEGRLPQPRKGKEKAKQTWPNHRIQRAFLYKALNRLIQSSGAYQAKKGYLDAFKAGHLIVLPLHDEGNWADTQSKQQAEEIKEIMEAAVKLNLPTKCDLDFVDRWL